MRLLTLFATAFACALALPVEGLPIDIPKGIPGLKIPIPVGDLSDVILQGLFDQFQKKGGKKYANDDAKKKGLKTFGENVKKIAALQAKKFKTNVKFGINQFTDLTDKEFAEQVLMKDTDQPTSFVDYDRKNDSFIPRRNRPNRLQEDFAFDWRDTPYAVGPIRDQSSCGCCWAFTAASVIQSVYGIKNKKTIQPSEQQICDCGMMDATSPGCNGGSSATALQYAVKTGVSLEAFYTAYNPTRATKANMCDDKSKPNTIKIKSATQIYPADDTEMAEALETYGPIAAAFKVGSSFRYYESGVFYDEDCNDPATYLGGHAISIVGYGEEDGWPYWIVKNSWGTSFGEDGYVKFAKGYDLCTMESRRVVYAVPV